MKKVKRLGSGFVYYEQASKSYRAGFTIGYDGKGRQVRKSVSAESKAEAINKRNELAVELLTQGYGQKTPNLNAWAAKWLSTTAFERLSPNVFADYKSKMNKYILPTLGQYLLEDIGPDEVRELHQVVRAAGVSGRTVQIVHTVLSTCLQDAMYDNIITSNPCTRVKRPAAQSKERDALTVMEAKRVLMTAADDDDPLTSFWAAALLTGARRSELIGLEKDRMALGYNAGMDISWQIQTLPWAHGDECKCREGRAAYLCPERKHAIPDGYTFRPCVGNRVFTPPKTGSSVRWTPFTPLLTATMSEYMVNGHVENPHNLVWATERGLPLGLKAVSVGWREALKKANVRQVDFHSARHTTASLLLEAGVSPEVISQILGHSSVVTTQGYMHVNRRMAVDAMGSLSELLA